MLEHESGVRLQNVNSHLTAVSVSNRSFCLKVRLDWQSGGRVSTFAFHMCRDSARESNKMAGTFVISGNKTDSHSSHDFVWVFWHPCFEVRLRWNALWELASLAKPTLMPARLKMCGASAHLGTRLRGRMAAEFQENVRTTGAGMSKGQWRLHDDIDCLFPQLGRLCVQESDPRLGLPRLRISRDDSLLEK